MSLFGGLGGGATSSGGQIVNGNNDYEVPDPPTDGISALCFSSQNMLAVASWDRSVRVWKVESSFNGVQCQAVRKIDHEGPVLCCGFSTDGTVLFSGGADCKLKMTNLQVEKINNK